MIANLTLELGFVPAGVYLLFVLFTNMVQPVFFMKKLFAAIAALENMTLVGVLCMFNQLIIGA